MSKYISELHEKGIFQYNSEELLKFEKNLIKYFSREFERFKNNNHPIDLGKGPLTLVPKKLAENHYDEEISLFKSFLDKKTMSYSMAYYNNSPDLVISSKLSLSEAQTRKFELISNRMKLKGSEKLLNFGCGFGYFESYLLERFPNLQICSLTHSQDQYDFIVQRKSDSRDPLSTNRFRLYYGQIDESSSTLLGKVTYDVVCSIGLMEHINNIEIFFRIINELLVDGGRMFHHLIVSRNLIPQLLDPEKTLIGDYFPGGKVIPFNALQQKFNDFTLTEYWFINGLNYWRTLDEWHLNFWKNLNKIYPDKMSSEKIDYWNNYFVLCKAMFYPEQGAAYGNGQYLFYKQS